MLRKLLATALVIWLTDYGITTSVRAEEGLSPGLRRELRLEMLRLCELMRNGNDAAGIELENTKIVPLTNHVPGTIYLSTGALVPFTVTSGNTVREFVALFQVSEEARPDDRVRNRAEVPLKKPSLLAFSQLDNRFPTVPDWPRAQVGPGVIVVPVTLEHCHDRTGLMTLRVDADWVGPKISVLFDEAATLPVGGCPL